jgi:RimJ/RimL family protein N-acetyltransferase
MITLDTARLTLRMFRNSDLDEYAEICADAEVMRYLGEGKTLNRGEAWRQIAMILGHWQLRGYGLWAVEHRESKRLIGRIGFFNPEGWPGFELGWVLGRKWWRNGYATEGARRALDYAFTELKQDHVISLIHPDNLASIKVAERLGQHVQGRTHLFGNEVLIYAINRKAQY